MIQINWSHKSDKLVTPPVSDVMYSPIWKLDYWALKLVDELETIVNHGRILFGFSYFCFTCTGNSCITLNKRKKMCQIPKHTSWISHFYFEKCFKADLMLIYFNVYFCIAIIILSLMIYLLSTNHIYWQKLQYKIINTILRKR